MLSAVKMVEKLSMEELETFLEEQCISAQVTNQFSSNEISGEQFLLLTELEIKELAPKIGDRVKLRELIKKVCLTMWGFPLCSVSESPLSNYCHQSKVCFGPCPLTYPEKFRISISH